MGAKKATSHPGVRYRSHSTRKNGVQYDRYFFIRHNVDGKRIEEGVGWSSEDWTAAKAAELRAELQNNKRTGQGPRTLDEKRKLEDHNRHQAELKEQAESLSLDDYWPVYYEHAKRTKKLSSAEKEESHFRLWLSPTLGKVPLIKIDIPQWDLLVATLSKAKKSKRTIEYMTGTLRRILKHAYHRGLVNVPPPTGKRIGATGPGQANRRMRVINPDEAEAIMQKLKEKDIYDWKITKFAFLTGARISECFKLRWRDIDRNRQVLLFPETKNKDPRQIPLSPAIIELLNSIDEGEIDEIVFLKKDGKPYTEAPYSFKRVVDVLELNNGRTKRDRISFHSIRHTVATRLAKTLNPRDLMDVMGWRTVQMAMRYVHGNENTKASALANLQGAMTAPKQKNGTVIPFRDRA